MTKMTFALAAVMLAGTSMTSVANADAVRVGFGFPLGSFVAHSNEGYGGREYRQIERPRMTRRDYRDDAVSRKVIKAKRPMPSEDADAAPKPAATPAIQTVKLESKLSSDPATTTVIEKTPATTVANAPAPTNTALNSDKETTSDNAAPKADAETTAPGAVGEHVCRRYSAAIAALVDVPCD
jgi:hypothetical protein